MCFEVEVEAEADFLRTFSCNNLFECRLSVNAFGDRCLHLIILKYPFGRVDIEVFLSIIETW